MVGEISFIYICNTRNIKQSLYTMAKLTSEITFTGSLGGITAYRMRGIDQIIVRKKGGPDKEKIKTSSQYDVTRRNNAEFSGRSAGSRWIMRMMQQQKPLADYNISGPINALLKPIQELDLTGEYGKRNVQLSKNHRLLEGFSLNRKTPLESVVRSSLSYSLSRDTLSAQIEIPELIPGINFHAPQRHAMYSIVAVLGVVPDLFYSEGNRYLPSSRDYDQLQTEVVETEWLPVQKGSSATSLQLTYDTIPPDQNFTLMLSIGIRFGKMAGTNTVEQVEHAGCARVLATA
jgi:hypothetical protein